MGKTIEFENGKVHRRFTEEWKDSGFINLDKLPEMTKVLVDQRKSMMEYIEALHDKIDWILEKNNCCDLPTCFTANCTSDHK